MFHASLRELPLRSRVTSSFSTVCFGSERKRVGASRGKSQGSAGALATPKEGSRRLEDAWRCHRKRTPFLKKRSYDPESHCGAAFVMPGRGCKPHLKDHF